MAISSNNKEDIIKNWDHPIELTEDKNLYDLLLVLSKENRRIDLDLEELYDDRFLDSASGEELKKIAKLVNAEMKTGEGEEKFRKRVRGEFAVQASDTTYESFATILLSILEANASSVEITTPPDTHDKVVEVRVDSGIINENPLSMSEINDLLDRTVSAGARVDIYETGAFAFAGDDTTLAGWDDGTWSSA